MQAQAEVRAQVRPRTCSRSVATCALAPAADDATSKSATCHAERAAGRRGWLSRGWKAEARHMRSAGQPLFRTFCFMSRTNCDFRRHSVLFTATKPGGSTCGWHAPGGSETDAASHDALTGGDLRTASDLDAAAPVEGGEGPETADPAAAAEAAVAAAAAAASLDCLAAALAAFSAAERVDTLCSRASVCWRAACRLAVRSATVVVRDLRARTGLLFRRLGSVRASPS